MIKQSKKGIITTILEEYLQDNISNEKNRRIYNDGCHSCIYIHI